MELWKKYNANTEKKRVGDCTVRAIATVMGTDWEDAFLALCVQGFSVHDMPSANAVWGSFLWKKGYRRAVICDSCPDCYTVRDFCLENPKGKYILALDSHVIAVIDGKYYDTFDSGDGVVNYYWYRKEDK